MKKMSSLKNAQAGVSLVELMVGLTIGLIITGGAMTLLFSNQQMLLGKESLDRTQEGFRFATTTITRMVRQASSFDKPTSNNELIINFDSTQRDCLGQVNNSTTNTLKLDSNNQLVCILDKDSTRTYVLAKNIGALQFSYGIQASGAVAYSSYYSNGTTVNSSVSSVWGNISSISTHISMIQQGNSNQPTLDFIATSHNIGMTKSLSSGGISTMSSTGSTTNTGTTTGSGSTTNTGTTTGSGSTTNTGTTTGSGSTTNTGTTTGNNLTKANIDQVKALLTVTYQPLKDKNSINDVTWLSLEGSTHNTYLNTQVTITLTPSTTLDLSDWSLTNTRTNTSVTVTSLSSSSLKIDVPNNGKSFSITLQNSTGTDKSTIAFTTVN
ncbi:PilW family protein [Acinetobacter brisouii]